MATSLFSSVEMPWVQGKKPGVVATNAAMSFFFAYTTERWQVTISGLVADIVTVEADLFQAGITKMPRKVALSASGNLGGIFDIDLVFAESQIVWYGFYYGDAVVSQPVVNIQCEGMFSPSIVEDLAERG